MTAEEIAAQKDAMTISVVALFRDMHQPILFNVNAEGATALQVFWDNQESDGTYNLNIRVPGLFEGAVLYDIQMNGLFNIHLRGDRLQMLLIKQTPA